MIFMGGIPDFSPSFDIFRNFSTIGFTLPGLQYMISRTRYMIHLQRRVMAGFSKIYFVGNTGGHMGADGISRPFVQILLGESDRQWYEPIYDDHTMSPLGGVKSFVPEAPNLPQSVLDAVIMFLPKLFKDCPTIARVAVELKGRGQADFHLGDVPADW